MPHPQPYKIEWLSQGRDLHVSQQCRLPYAINPFKDEVLCDVAPLEVWDVILGQPYMWKHRVVYESRPRSVIITLGKRLYRILEVAPKASISLILAKQCTKVISQTGKFVLLMILSQGEKRLWPQAWPLHGIPPHNKSKWTKSWKNTRTYLPHPMGHLFIAK